MLRPFSVVVVLVASLFAPTAHAKSNVAKLGDAWRAFQAGDYAGALKTSRRVSPARLKNPDYLHYIAGQSAYFVGKLPLAIRHFNALQRDRDSRFRHLARWRLADTAWRQKKYRAASRAYQVLLRKRVPDGDPAVARFRIAEAAAERRATDDAIRQFREFRRRYPAHTLEPQAEARLVELGGKDAAELSATDRIERAQRLTVSKAWHRAIDELEQIDGALPADIDRDRKFWTAMTLFKMRRQYKRAGDIFLSIYSDMGSKAAEALFHGARALSRADFDKQAIRWYLKLVQLYPRSRWANEAAFLAGWLEFNLGNYKEAIPLLEEMRQRYPRSRFADAALWYQAFSRYFLGDYERALPDFAALGRLRSRRRQPR